MKILVTLELYTTETLKKDKLMIFIDTDGRFSYQQTCSTDKLISKEGLRHTKEW